VHAVTSRQRYDDSAARLPARETVAGVTIHRVWTTRFGRSRLIGRALDYATFYASAFLKLAALVRRGDVIVAKTDPPLISVCAALAAALRGARLVNWLQDIFPETATRLGMRGLRTLFGGVRDWTIRQAAANVVLGPRMAEEVSRLVPGDTALRIIPNWADGSQIRPLEAGQSALRREWGLADKFVVAHSGNLGRAHDVETVVGAAARLRADAAIAFLFIGGGYHFPRLERARTANMALRGYVPGERLCDSLGAADVHLVSLNPALEGLIVPSKFFSIAAAGRPVIFIGDPRGEIGRLLAEQSCGIAVRPGDVEALLAAIGELRASPARRREMGARARAAFEAHWDKPIAMRSWRALMDELRA
jgi:glycosyltransferase involved in cell wall biosynthesis